MKKPTITARLRYRFDNFMSRGVIALVAGLFAVTLCMVLTAALILFLARLRPDASTPPFGLAEAFWQVLMRSIDTGTVAGDSLWTFRIVGFLVTLGGIFIASALIGILANGLDQRLEDLRRGRSLVIESGHTVILGWSPQIFTVISELAQANRNLRKGNTAAPAGDLKRSACIAILADQDKLEMEEQIHSKVPNTLGTRIVCRSGDPLDPDDIKIVSPETSRAILLLSPGGPYPDLPVAKSLLALTRDRGAREHPYHIVTALQRLANLETVRMIGGDEVQVFLVDRLIAYMIAQTCRQPGLSVVYSELFSFVDAAIYFKDIPVLAGNKYGDALHRFENSALLGLRTRDGEVRLNPPADSLIQPGDRLVLLAAQEGAVQLAPQAGFQVDQGAFNLESSLPVALDRLLILGWNRRAPMILEQLSSYMPSGSQVLVFAPYPVEQMQAECPGEDYFTMRLAFQQGNPADRPALEKLVAEDYHYMVILSPTDAPDIQIADAATMLSLLHLRDIARKTGRKFSIVSEILDVRNRELTEVTSAEDVIISERLVALSLTQVAENKDALPLFADLLTPGGPEIYLKPAEEYILPGRPVSFHTVIEAALRRGQTAFGYRLLSQAGEPENSFGVHLNPEKSALITFGEQDRIIVLAES
jgi:hypothetical protein